MTPTAETLLRVVAASAAAAAASAAMLYGVDISTPVSASAAACMKAQHGVDFAISRAWYSDGAGFDDAAAESGASFKAAGVRFDVYMFPCSFGLDAASQVAELMGNLSSRQLQFGAIWFDVETNPDPKCAWRTNKTENCAYMRELVKAAEETNAIWGVYSSIHMWSLYMEDSPNACSVASSAGLPLWYPHYERPPNPTFSDFVPFGGWKAPTIKQYDDGSSGAYCGVGVDNNVAPTMPPAAPAAPAVAAARLLVNTSLEYGVYDSAGTTVVQGKPYFAFGNWLNPPISATLYDGTGALVWSFVNATGEVSYILDTARHCEPSGSPDGDVDVFVAVAGGGGVDVFGLSSASKTAEPRWSTNLPGCSMDLGGGTYTGIQASDSGNRVAVQCIHMAATPTSRVYSLAGQSGKVEWNYDLGNKAKAGQGQVQVSTDGAWVMLVNEQGTPTPNTAEAFVIDGATGKLRDSVIIPFFITAALSDSGDYVVVGDEPAVHVHKWDGAKYSLAYDLNPPPGAVGTIPWDVQISTGSDATEVVIVGYISGDVRTVQVAASSLPNGTLTTNWISKTNSQYQENPTIRADGDYIALALWGDVGEPGYPSVVLLKTGSAAPVFSYVTPGSMMAVDLNVVAAAGADDTIFLAAAGKHVPANVAGNGGDAFAWEVTVKAN